MAFTDAELDNALKEVQKEYSRQYRDTLPTPTDGGLAELDARRTARLAGVLIKRDFSKEQPLSVPSPVSGAWFGYDLRYDDIKEGGLEHQRFVDSWQAQVFAALDDQGNPMLVAEGILSERDTILRIARAARWLICGRKQQLREAMSLGVIPVGTAVAVDSAAIKLGAAWLAANVPALAFVTPAVLVAFTVFLVGFGLNRFCDSARLSGLLDYENREE
jgi:hypothetical protein